MKQGILQESAVQYYPIGLRYAKDDRVFRYSKAGGALTAMKAGHQGHVATECNTVAVAYAAGATKIAILDGDVTHGVDYYANGYIWIMDLVTGIFRMHRIKSSTASNGTSVTLTLDDPLTHDVGASTWITAWPSIYSNILGGDSTKMSNVVVPLIPVTSDYYFWGQTWGPCFGTAFNVVPGVNDNQREVYFNIDGALMAGDDLSLDTTVRQRAGFILTNTTPGGDQFYMLQLAP